MDRKIEIINSHTKGLVLFRGEELDERRNIFAVAHEPQQQMVLVFIPKFLHISLNWHDFYSFYTRSVKKVGYQEPDRILYRLLWNAFCDPISSVRFFNNERSALINRLADIDDWLHGPLPSRQSLRSENLARKLICHE